MQVLYNGVDITDMVRDDIDLQISVNECLPATGTVDSIDFSPGFVRYKLTYVVESTLQQMANLRRYFPDEAQNEDPRLTPDPVS